MPFILLVSVRSVLLINEQFVARRRAYKWPRLVLFEERKDEKRGSHREDGLADAGGAANFSREQLIDITFLLIFWLYPSLTQTTFSTFICEEFDDGSRYLKADLSLLCDTTELQLFQLLAAFLIIAYPIGVPIMYYVVVRSYRHELSRVHAIQKKLTREGYIDAVGEAPTSTRDVVSTGGHHLS
eukprot:2915917-Prymnesium_polylepis.1